MKTFLAPNRIATYLGVLAGAAAAAVPAVENLDTTSTVSIIGGLAGVVIVIVKWLDGWQKHEERQAWADAPHQPVPEPPPSDPPSLADPSLDDPDPNIVVGGEPLEQHVDLA